MNHFFSKGHYSLKGTASTLDLKKGIDKAHKYSGMTSFTEAYSKRIKDLFYSPTRGVCAHGQCVITWNNFTYEKLECGFEVLSTKTWFSRKGHEQPPVELTWVALERGKDIPVIVPMVAHFPSHVEGKHRLTGPFHRVSAWVAAARGFRKTRKKIQRKFKDPIILFTFDSNLNHRRPWVRAYTKLMFGGKLCLKNHGTHGNREIDVTRRWGPVTFITSSNFRKTPGLDHVFFTELYRVRGTGL